jgi:peptide/nickel transport system permease protein
MAPGKEGFLLDRLHHLVLPVLALTLSVLPSRFLLMRNTAAAAMDRKYILYAKERGLSPRKIRWIYLLRNIAQPFVTMVGMSVSLCVGGSLIIENIFSINGMGKLLTDAVYSLDYPLMQGILFVTTAIMTLSIIVTDLICLLIDPKVMRGERHG